MRALRVVDSPLLWAAGLVSWNWYQDYDRERITEELEKGGFVVESVWSDLTGTPYAANMEWIGVVARRN